MGEVNTRAYLVLIARLVTSAVFLFAALPKIQDPAAFAVSVEGFRVVEGPWAIWVALLMPWLELVIGIGLLIPQIRRGSGLLIVLLLLLFIGLHASAWIRGLDVSCGCFGNSEAPIATNGLSLILRNVALLSASLMVLIRDWRSPRQPSLTEDMEAPRS